MAVGMNTSNLVPSSSSNTTVVISPNVTDYTSAAVSSGTWVNFTVSGVLTASTQTDGSSGGFLGDNDSQLAVSVAIIVAASAAAIVFVALVSRLRGNRRVRSRKKMKEAGRQMASLATQQHRGGNQNDKNAASTAVQRDVTFGP